MIRELDFWHLASAYVSTMSSPVLVLAFRFGLSIVFSFGELLLSHYHKDSVLVRELSLGVAGELLYSFVLMIGH